MKTRKLFYRVVGVIIVTVTLLSQSSVVPATSVRAGAFLTIKNYNTSGAHLPPAAPYAGWEEVSAGSATGGGISDSSGHSASASVATTPHGKLYIAWSETMGDIAPFVEIYVQQWNGSSWEEVGPGSASGGGISDNGGWSLNPSIAVAPDGTPYVAWDNDYSGGNWEIYVRRWNGSSWEEVGPGSASGGGISDNNGSSGYPSAATAPDGTPYVAWKDNSSGDDEIYVRRWNGSNWEEVGTGSASSGGISDNSGLSQDPSIAIAPDGTPYAAWADTSGGGYEVYVRRWNGISWEEVGAGSASGGGISDNGGYSRFPSAAIAPDGTPYVAWKDDSSGVDEIFVRQWNGSSWEEVGTGSASGGGISNNGSISVSPSMVIAPDGTPYIAWQNLGDGSYEIYVRRWNGSSWEEVGVGSASGGGISDNNGSSGYPSAAIAPGGTPYVAWQDDNSGNAQIYVRRRVPFLVFPATLDFGVSLTVLTLSISPRNPSDTWTLSENIPWLRLSGTSGTGPATVTVTAHRHGLSVGTYDGTINATVGGETVTVNVKIEVVTTILGTASVSFADSFTDDPDDDFTIREVPLRGVAVSLLQNGTVISTTTSQNNGGYRFEVGTPNTADSYRVRVTLVDNEHSPPVFQVRYAAALGNPVVYAEIPSFNLELSEPSIVKNVNFSLPDTVEIDPNIDKDHLGSLALIYYHTQQAVSFMTSSPSAGLGATLDYELPVDIYAYDEGDNRDRISYYVDDSSIHIGSNESGKTGLNRPMNREWHEMFHHLMQDTIGIPLDRECNHGGHLNDSTADSWTEGWAEAWAAILQDHLGYPEKEETDLYHGHGGTLSLEFNGRVWDHLEIKWWSSLLCQDSIGEELAVASLIWDLYDPVDSSDNEQDWIALTPQQLWTALTSESTNSLDSVKDLYDSLAAQGIGANDSDGDGETDLQEIFVTHGFFADDNDDQIYQEGEEVGWGGEPGRRDFPRIPGAAVEVNLVNDTGEPLNCVEGQCPSLWVEVEFAPPNEYFSYAYKAPLFQDSGNLIGLILPPTRTVASVSIRLLRGGQPDETFTMDNHTFWSAVATTESDHIAEITFTFAPKVYLPIILKNYIPGPAPTNRPPNTPSTPSPANGATNQSVNVGLGWTGGDPDGDSVTYDVYLEADDSSPDALVCNDVSSTVCGPGTLNSGTHYYWQVVARDAHASTKTGPVWDFTTVVEGGATAIDAGWYHTCGLISGDGVKCWGWNGFGQLGDGTTMDRHTPVDVSGLSSGVSALAGGGYHTCMLTSGGGVRCWGHNLYGQLGDGTTTDRHTPVDVSGLSSGVTTLAAGVLHTCALTSGGGVKCWGNNGSGQLGDGTTTDRHTPVDVSGLSSGVTALAAGGHHTCALTSGGGVKCWGWNGSGQLGDGTTTDRHTPVDVSGLSSGVTALAAGEIHTCALTSGNGVRCWGNNYNGQLGDGTTTERHTPVDVSGLSSDVSALAAGWIHTCAVTSGGGVKCWGWNYDGQLGDGTTTERHTPVDVSGLSSGMTALAAGEQHTCALTSGGGIKCWGSNEGGQLGDGTTTDRHTPVDVVGF